MEVPTVAAAFLADHIRSPEELQLLLTAMHADDRWWDAPAVAHELGISQAKARRALDHLASHNLFDIRVTADVRYRYHPGTAELRDAVRVVSDAFHANPVAVINLVAGATRRSIRDFADAFRIRKDDR